MTLRQKQKNPVVALGIFILLLLWGGVGRTQAQVGVGGNLFEKGRSRATIYGSMGSAFGDDYFVLGLGGGYFLLRGLELGLDGEAWLGSDPSIYKVTPQLRYVAQLNTAVFPYVGAFYRRTIFEGFDDLDSAGGRAGIYSALSSRTYVGAGVVYEKYMDCDENIYSSCDDTYPEFTFSVVF